MNFFDHQDQARKRTGQLIFLFFVAVLLLIMMTNLLVAAFLGFLTTSEEQMGFNAFLAQLNWKNLSMVSLGVIAVVGGGTLFRLSSLASTGGKGVAEMLGGSLVNHDNAANEDEKKLLNIVEEMAIASGTPTPPVYVMKNEGGINAFAAGFNINDAVIGVTKGCIEQLNREELQGVVAHEFSHILHGDMRINLRLMGVLHGILLIGLIGYHLLDHLWWSSRRSRGKKDGQIGIIGLAIGLIVVGYGGVFIGNLIKAAVSRQREFLADASAVQFTRNPEGISNALKKIGGYPTGTLMESPKTEEASHLLFGSGTRRLVSGMFATHPPLPERIQRIEPNWDGEYKESSRPTPSASAATPSMGAHAAGVSMMVDQAINSIGNPGPEHVDYAHNTLSQMPDLWHNAAQHKDTARSVFYGLLIARDSADQEIIQHQLQHIKNLDGKSFSSVKKLIDAQQPKEEERLPLIDIALPHLRDLKGEELKDFKTLLNALIRADKRVDLFEWTLHSIITHYLANQQGKQKPTTPKYRKLSAVQSHCQVLFSTLAMADNNPEFHKKAFQSALEKSGLEGLAMLPGNELGLGKLNVALKELNLLFPLEKPKLLKASIACISGDGNITATEKELIRAISETLDCPMPPIL